MFRGGCTLEAAEEVCGFEPLEPWEVLDAIAQLVDKCLLLARGSDEAPRHRMLETVRQYAAERLRERGGSPGANKV